VLWVGGRGGGGSEQQWRQRERGTRETKVGACGAGQGSVSSQKELQSSGHMDTYGIDYMLYQALRVD
jgi:hypothetical protein